MGEKADVASTDNRLGRILRRGVIGVVVAVIAFGAAGWLGWVLRKPLLHGGFGGLPAMVPNTAVGFILGGLALWFGYDHGGHSLKRALSHFLSTAVALIGLLTVAEYVLGWNPGFDRWLLPDREATTQGGFVGRSSLPTAVNFALLGPALLLLGVRQRTGSKPAEWFAVVFLVISLLALIGHLCNVPLFYGWRSESPGTGMSIWTVLSFTALGCGILCAQPVGGLMEIITSPTPSGRLARRLILAPVLIPLSTGLLRLLGVKFSLLDPEFSGWLFAFLNILIFTLVIWWGARQLFQSEENLGSLNESLEKRVQERTDELSRAMAALQQSEQRIGMVLDTALDAVITANERGNITGWNREAERTFGWTHAEVIDRSLSSTIIPPRFREAHERGIRHFLATQEGPVLNKRIEITAVHRSGREFPVELAITPIRLADGFIFSAFVRDITQRKLAEAALQESKERFRTLAESLPHLVWTCETDGSCDYLSRQWVEYTGRPAEEQLGSGWADHIHPDDRGGVRGAWADAVQQGKQLDIEFRIRRADGVHRWFKTRAVPLRDSAGRVAKWFGSNTDFDDFKRSEEALRSSEERFRVMADRAPVLIWMSGTDGHCNWFNQVWLEFVGRTMLQELGNGWLENVHPEDTQRCMSVYQEAFQARRPFSMEYRLKRHDGIYRWIVDNGTPLLGFGGEFTGYIGSCLDVTERRQLEQDTRHLNEVLEQRVKERTVELEVANKELEAFSYSVSHDLRAPIRHIGGFVELLTEHLEPVLDQPSRRQLGVITDAAQRMGQLIDSLLSFSRMGRAEIYRTRVNMEELVREVLAELEPEMGNREIDWSIVTLPPVFADRPLLKQVWLNLLSNAIKYTRDRRRAEIQIGCHPGREETEFWVRDNGAGFDMKYVDKLFGVFQRLHLSDEFEGTGVGLANVRRITSRHGGRTWAEGRLGAGATFHFTLPNNNHHERKDA